MRAFRPGRLQNELPDIAQVAALQPPFREAPGKEGARFGQAIFPRADTQAPVDPPRALPAIAAADDGKGGKQTRRQTVGHIARPEMKDDPNDGVKRDDPHNRIPPWW